MTDRFTIPIECRADESREGPGRIYGTILETGRVASDRQEVFIPGAAIFPSTGVELLRGHRGEAVLTFDPIVEGSEIRIDARLPDTQLGRQVAATKSAAASGRRSVSSLCLWTKHAYRVFVSCGRRSSRARRWFRPEATHKRGPKSGTVRHGGIVDRGND